MSAATVVTVVLDEHQTRVQEMANEPLEIEVLVSKRPLQKAGVRMATGFITASQLHARYKVPNLDPVTRQGYQRPPQMPRVARLVARLKDGSVDLPTALLLNLRKDQVAGRIVEREGKTFLVLRPGDALYVVDGQHRVIAVVDRLFLEDLAKWFDFEIPFVAMLGADEAMEMTEFYVVNSTAKQVPTDLAYELLQRRAEADAGLMEQLDGSGQAWIVRAQSLVTFLNDAGVWKDRIRLAATSKGDTTINNAGMVNSLKPLLQMAYFGTTITEDNQVKILDAFWRGLQRVLPECFEEPAEYSLQKSGGSAQKARRDPTRATRVAASWLPRSARACRRLQSANKRPGGRRTIPAPPTTLRTSRTRRASHGPSPLDNDLGLYRGLTVIYPAAHSVLADAILRGGGALVSQFPTELRRGGTTFSPATTQWRRSRTWSWWSRLRRGPAP